MESHVLLSAYWPSTALTTHVLAVHQAMSSCRLVCMQSSHTTFRCASPVPCQATLVVFSLQCCSGAERVIQRRAFCKHIAESPSFKQHSTFSGRLGKFDRSDTFGSVSRSLVLHFLQRRYRLTALLFGRTMLTRLCRWRGGQYPPA